MLLAFRWEWDKRKLVLFVQLCFFFLPPEGLLVLNPQLRREPHVPVVLGMTRYLHCFCSRVQLFWEHMYTCLKLMLEKTKCSNSLIICMPVFFFFSSAFSNVVLNVSMIFLELFKYPCDYSNCWLIAKCISQSRHDIYHSSSAPFDVT